MNRRTWLALLVVGGLVSAATAGPVKLIKEWRGSLDDETLVKEAPKNSVITTAADLEKLWKAWKIEGKAPEVDFKKEIVIVGTTVGSRINIGAQLSDKGDLRVGGLATSDLGKGFRYHMATISREGIKTIDGKELKD